MVSKPVMRVLERVKKFSELSRGFSASCPSHDDRVNSLSISEGADGRALIFCHAGCDFEQILKALGLRKRDLFVQRKDPPWC
jgi:putative DNA primase/helicase